VSMQAQMRKAHGARAGKLTLLVLSASKLRLPLSGVLAKEPTLGPPVTL